MLSVLSEANNSDQFKALVPKAVAIMKQYASQLRTGETAVEDLIIEKRLSKSPDEYTNLVPQAVAAQHLVAEGGQIHAGQNVSFVITHNDSRIAANRAIPTELTDENTPYDPEAYIELVVRSATNLLLPLELDTNSLKAIINL